MTHFFGFALFYVFSTLLSTFASEIKCPIHIDELGDIVVTQPILEVRPEGAETILSPPLRHNYFPYSFERYVRFRPELRTTPLDIISKYFMERNILNLASSKEQPFSPLDEQFISILKDRLDHFNPSFLDGIDDISFEGKAKIAVFGATCFRMFRAAYPGLSNVKLTKNEIVDLVLIASGWFMHSEEEEENNRDIFLANCLLIYHPQYSNILPAFRSELKDVYTSGSRIVFGAVEQLHVKKIEKRNYFLLENITASEQLCHFLDTPEVFFTFLPNVMNINLVDSTEFHVLFDMIKQGHFYPETILRPELKFFRIPFYNQEYFKDFYSEALYFAVKYFNDSALRFLLNLDYEMYDASEVVESSDSESGEDSVSESDDSEYILSRSISQESFNNLRAIFLSETADQVIESVPNLFEFSFGICDIHFIMRNYKENFPSVLRIKEYYNGRIEEMFREGISVPLNPRKKRERSVSPTNFEYL